MKWICTICGEPYEGIEAPTDSTECDYCHAEECFEYTEE